MKDFVVTCLLVIVCCYAYLYHTQRNMITYYSNWQYGPPGCPRYVFAVGAYSIEFGKVPGISYFKIKTPVIFHKFYLYNHDDGSSSLEYESEKGYRFLH